MDSKKRMDKILEQLEKATLEEAIVLQKEYCALQAKEETKEFYKTKYNTKKDAIAREYKQSIYQ